MYIVFGNPVSFWGHGVGVLFTHSLVEMCAFEIHYLRIMKRPWELIPCLLDQLEVCAVNYDRWERPYLCHICLGRTAKYQSKYWVKQARTFSPRNCFGKFLVPLGCFLLLINFITNMSWLYHLCFCAQLLLIISSVIEASDDLSRFLPPCPGRSFVLFFSCVVNSDSYFWITGGPVFLCTRLQPSLKGVSSPFLFPKYCVAYWGSPEWLCTSQMNREVGRTIFQSCLCERN